MNSFDGIISTTLVESFGWTLLHSLWQGILIAVLLYITVNIFKKGTAALKYNLSIGALALFLLTTLTTFVIQYKNQQPLLLHPLEISSVDEIVEIAPLEEDVFYAENDQVPWLDFAVDLFQNNLPALVIAWSIGVGFLTLRLLGGFYYTHRLRTMELSPVSTLVENKVKILLKKLNIQKTVKIYASAKVKVPLIIGHLKPIVLLPLTITTGLSTDQIEYILAHEIAHIKRNDFLINLIQSIAETLFFFNPAVWWISSKIREERENCCDDIAIALTGNNPLKYVKTLAELNELILHTPNMAISFAGNKKEQLFQRIKRLMERDNHKNSNLEKIITVTLLLITIATIGIAFNKGDIFKKDNGRLFLEASAQSPDHIIELSKSFEIVPGKQFLRIRDTTIVEREAVDKDALIKEQSEMIKKLQYKIEDLEAKLEKTNRIVEVESVKEQLRDMDQIKARDYKNYVMDVHRQLRNLQLGLEKSMIELKYQFERNKPVTEEIRKSLELEIRQMQEEFEIEKIRTLEEVMHMIETVKDISKEQIIKEDVARIREKYSSIEEMLSSARLLHLESIEELKQQQLLLKEEMAKRVKRMKKLKEKILYELKSDNLVDKKDKRVTIEFKKNRILVNNKKISEQLKMKYEKLLREFSLEDFNKDDFKLEYKLD
ncbi:M56 family metallopeptidase [Fulvivirgaceae bacterium BMA10]|uniref:M56 family metallopeptidase n=1 Tax=Splendidivirga corallicola TaxID=3051826 RepID=A0ABT8KRX8_9BACT|nr:M56 family metallopeptidase [Fulvivirgaceae bacterium BMA10]